MLHCKGNDGSAGPDGSPGRRGAQAGGVANESGLVLFMRYCSHFCGVSKCKGSAGSGMDLYRVSSSRDAFVCCFYRTVRLDLEVVSLCVCRYGYMLPRCMWTHDSTLAERICQEGDYHCYKSELRVEGGALAFNGAGTVITTESVLLDKHRNPGQLKEDIEQELKDYLGCERVVWLEKGLPYDNTGGHVDNLAAFVSESEVVLAWIDEDRDPVLHHSLSKTKATLETHGLTVHKLHLPDQIFRTSDESPKDVCRESQGSHLQGSALESGWQPARIPCQLLHSQQGSGDADV